MWVRAFGASQIVTGILIRLAGWCRTLVIEQQTAVIPLALLDAADGTGDCFEGRRFSPGMTPAIPLEPFPLLPFARHKVWRACWQVWVMVVGKVGLDESIPRALQSQC